ncbi:hypothetical protein Taro_005755, partial [Colocasia esculenta]|nr:hypothetical protein [Colocasia esculenta]
MPQGQGYLSRSDYAQRTRDKVILLDDMMPRFGAPRTTSHNLSSLDSGNDIVAQVNSGDLAINGGVDVSRISRRKGVYYYSQEEDYPEYLPSDPELFTFIQNFIPSHMTAGDLCLSVERRYLESAILKSRDSLLGTCAFSYPSFPLGFAIQHRLPRAVDLGSFSHDLESYTRSRKISPAVWNLMNSHQARLETNGLQLLPCHTRYVSGDYDNRCLLNRIVDLTSPSWYGNWSVLSSHIFHFGATEWLMGVLHHYGEILKSAGIYEAVEAALYDYPCHTGLLQALMERFNPRWNTFGTAEGETSIDLWSFHRISGLPISGHFYEEIVLDDLHTYRSNGAGQYILLYSLRFLTKVWRDLVLVERTDDPESPVANPRVSQNAWLRYFYNGPFCFFDNFATEGRRLEEYNQLSVGKPHHGRFIFAPENRGWNPRRLPDRTYLAAYLVYWLSSFVVPHGEEEQIRPGLIYPACLLAEGLKLAIAPAALANIFHGLGSLSSHSSPRDRKTLLPTHYLSVWAGLLLPGLCQTVDLPRPMAPLILLFRNRPCEDLINQLTGARYSLSFLPNGEQFLLQFGAVSRGIRPYSVRTSSGITYHLPHGGGSGVSLYKDWLLCIRPGVLVCRRGSSLVLEPYYPSRFARNFGYDQSVPLNAEFPLDVRLYRDHCLHMNAASWWNYFCREEVNSTCILPALEATGRIDLFYARWWFDRSNIFRLAPKKLKKFEETRLKKKGLPLILMNVEFLKAHFRGVMRSYLRRYNSKTSKKGKPDSGKQYYYGEMLPLDPIELLDRKATDIHAPVPFRGNTPIRILALLVSKRDRLYGLPIFFSLVKRRVLCLAPASTIESSYFPRNHRRAEKRFEVGIFEAYLSRGVVGGVPSRRTRTFPIMTDLPDLEMAAGGLRFLWRLYCPRCEETGVTMIVLKDQALTNFIVETTVPTKEEGATPKQSSFLDRSSCLARSNVILALTPPGGATLEYAFWFAFSTLNNVTEYEALISRGLTHRVGRSSGQQQLLARSKSMVGFQARPVALVAAPLTPAAPTPPATSIALALEDPTTLSEKFLRLQPLNYKKEYLLLCVGMVAQRAKVLERTIQAREAGGAKSSRPPQQQLVGPDLPGVARLQATPARLGRLRGSRGSLLKEGSRDCADTSVCAVPSPLPSPLPPPPPAAAAATAAGAPRRVAAGATARRRCCSFLSLFSSLSSVR